MMTATLARRSQASPYRDMFDIAACEDMYEVCLSLALEIAKGGDEAFRELDSVFKELAEQWRDGMRTPAEDQVVEEVLVGWLAPLLYYYTKAGGNEERQALGYLKQRCVHHLGEMIDHRHPDEHSSVTLEIAVAQGFRHTANLRADPAATHRGESDSYGKKRAVLVEAAEDALAHASFWYAQMALIQALTLWSIPDDLQGRPQLGHTANPKSEVGYWLELAGTRSAVRDPGHSRGLHPFVEAAGDLAVLAMTSGHPDQFCWTDESRVLHHVGSAPHGDVDVQADERILVSSGWASLHPKAQSLAADVLVLLNLADRGDSPADREARLQRCNRTELPPCMTTDRTYLAVTRTAGSAEVSEPGTNCAETCKFRLCPYPPVGSSSNRTELTEGLCRKLAAEAARMVPWQKRLSPKERARFWNDMSRRSRPRPAAD